MSAINGQPEEEVVRVNDTLTIVGETYMVSVPGRYVVTTRIGANLVTNVHMNVEQARALLAGLQEAEELS